jgi:8-oxo-dGTP pyrophosphatase MutT (NUDIX family)
MAKQRIRPIAIGIFRHADKILVFEGRDPSRDLTFYRPLGGAIHFGETSGEALRREMREELGSDVDDLRFLGVLESIFTYRGMPGHELVMVHEGRLRERALYEQREFQATEGTRHPTPIRCLWLPLSSFEGGERTLFPDGLLAMLTSGDERGRP